MRQISALLRSPRLMPSTSTVCEVFTTMGFKDTVINVKPVADRFAVRTRIKSVKRDYITELVANLRASDVEVSATSRGMMFIFSYR